MKIKAVIFDADGVVINSPGYFSDQYQKEFGVPSDLLAPFFKGKFQECLIGKADLKEELKSFLKNWQWKGTVDELLDYWFKAEHYIDERIVKEIERLRGKGIKCYLGNNQEKYRAEYIKKEMGLEKIFDGIYFSSDIGHKKPDKDFFEFINADLWSKEGIKPEEIMFWDDQEKIVLASKEFGWQGFFYENFDEFYEIISQI